jgi:hypothetical protein
MTCASVRRNSAPISKTFAKLLDVGYLIQHIEQSFGPT